MLRHQLLVADHLGLEFLLPLAHLLVFLDELAVPLIQGVALPFQVLLFLQEAPLQLIEFLAPVLGLLFEVHLHLQELILGLQLGLFLEGVRFFPGFIQDLLPQGLQGLLVCVHDVFAIEETGGEARSQGHTFNQNV